VSGPRIITVTARERAVIVELAADGASNAEIAERLGLTTEGVANRFKNLMRRTGYTSRTALAVDLLRGRVKLRVIDNLANER
jgi:DNA-binding NarL/FixJ family response regulator